MKGFNKKVYVFILLFIWGCLVYGYESRNPECPVTIFYGLNESHSNDWAQSSDNGTIGVSLYDKESQNLIFRIIDSDGSFTDETVTNGEHLEINILLFDSDNNPHIFVSGSDALHQKIRHYYRLNNAWNNEMVIDFQNEGGPFIYEMSGDIDSNDRFHLLVLKTNSNPDSDNYYMAFADAHLYYINNLNENWNYELVFNYNTIWTLDDYSKMMNRQDIVVDSNQQPHIIFGEQVNAMSYNSPSRLCYAHKSEGLWQIETAFTYNEGSRDDTGWYPSIDVDSNNNPAIGCCYIARVSSGSAIFAKLYYLERNTSGVWQEELVCSGDDGYYGTDGRNYTGGLVHLKFDNNNDPHLIFSDIASSHANMNYFNLGNIRYAVRSGDEWNLTTIYRQPLPNGFLNATEMYDMCMVMTENPFNISIVGQELTVIDSDNYNVEMTFQRINNVDVSDNHRIPEISLQNYPNPFKEKTNFRVVSNKKYQTALLEIYNVKGEKVKQMDLAKSGQGIQDILWNTTDQQGKPIASGMYFAKLHLDGKVMVVRKCLLIK